MCRSIKYAFYRPKTILDLSKTFWLVQNDLDMDQDAKLLVVFGTVQNKLDRFKIVLDKEKNKALENKNMHDSILYWYLLVGNCSSSNHSSSPLFPWHQKFNIAIQEAMVGGASILIWGEILYCRTKMPRHISLIIVVRKTDCFLLASSHKSFRYFINEEWFLAKTGSLYLYGGFHRFILFQKGLNNDSD